MSDHGSTPHVSVGLGTQVGLATAMAAFVGGIVSVLVDGDHTPETLTAFAVATVTLVTTLIGRFAQAYALAQNEAFESLEDQGPHRALGGPDEPYEDDDEWDDAHEKADLHDAEGA